MKRKGTINLYRDLRDPRDRTRLNPWAHFQVLAIMLAPSDRALQKRFLAYTGVRQTKGDPFSPDALGNLLDRSKNRGRQVGFMIAALCQLFYKHGVKAPTLEMVIDVIQNELSANVWRGVHPGLAPQHMPRSGRLLRELYGEFGSVGHYWAAVIVREQEVRHQAWMSGRVASPELQLPPDMIREEAKAFPRSVDDLPGFLAQAEEIRCHFDGIPKTGAFARNLKATPFSFIIPDRLRIEQKLDVLPLPADRLELIRGMKQKG